MNDSLPDANLHQTDTGVTTQPILPSTARDVSGTGTRPPDSPPPQSPRAHTSPLPTPPFSPPHRPHPLPVPSFPGEELLECLPLLEDRLRQQMPACLLLVGGSTHWGRNRQTSLRLPGIGSAVDPRNSGAPLLHVLLSDQMVQSSKTAGAEGIEKRRNFFWTSRKPPENRNLQTGKKCSLHHTPTPLQPSWPHFYDCI